MNNDRYCISYLSKDDRWSEVFAKTRNEAKELYDMVSESEVKFKVLYDTINGEQLEQT